MPPWRLPLPIIWANCRRFAGVGDAHVLAVIHWGRWLPAAVQSRLPEQVASIPINSAQIVACAVIALLTAVNVRGVREGALVQNLFTLLKVGALVALIAAGMSRLQNASHFVPLLPGKEMMEAGFLAGVAVALSQALFAYDAWYNVTFVAEEVHESDRTLPRALVLGTLLVTLAYLAANEAYLAVLPVERDSGGPREAGGGPRGRGGFRPGRLQPGDRGHPGLDFRLRQWADTGQGAGALRHGPRGALLPPLRRLDARKTPRTALDLPGSLVDGPGLERLV